jgi:hypothetical protein
MRPTDLHGMPRATLFGLINECQILAVRKRFANKISSIADDDKHTIDVRFSQGIQDVFDNRLTAGRHQHLWQIGLHASSFACRQYDRQSIWHHTPPVIQFVPQNLGSVLQLKHLFVSQESALRKQAETARQKLRFSPCEAIKSFLTAIGQTASFVHLSANPSTGNDGFFCLLTRSIAADFDVKCLTNRGWGKIMDIVK